ncbi:CoA ester lyase [Mycobacterium marinum]|uniref:aldolase/citrate lyase family protein n=1 Tax=Mycobacterium marinum TaxID=1781 RepID=UPI000358B823|nr:aldolase/citrate lyase family protein [Mycobacterium marinum]AXN51506.1 Malyl-CoA lyase [Mycobacterium marinum]EPQ74510.1 Hydroxymethylglutaryl-CoA lyase [Mycobacterium marinum str. Europe]RFZ18858.1 Malyl-CoA lyase [Mycobacterium marinum]RFZ26252.1 Malyl-CoA lyase [Mycobacterium marinum]RFZ29511.1 Malyl-CoA lyase [Mycobacterium marinum]
MKPIPRSLLFTPATNTQHYPTAAAVHAEALILDLEDSVAPRDKAQARRDALNFLCTTTPAKTMAAIRVNAPDTLDGWRDLTALLDSAADPDFLMLPKVQSAAEIGLVKRLLRQSQKTTRLIATAESAVVAANPDCALDPRLVDAVIFGSADMAADLGAEPSAAVVRHARSTILSYAAAAKIPVIDAPFFDIDDTPGLRQAVREAVAEGFAGKAAIHPDHVALINSGFLPGQSEINWAREVLKSAQAGAGSVGGRMVDEAMARRARGILARAQGVNEEEPCMS